MITILSSDNRGYRLDLIPKEGGIQVTLRLSNGRHVTGMSDLPLHVALEHAEAMLRPLFEPWPPAIKGELK